MDATTNNFPFNQSYRKNLTFKNFPELEKIYSEYSRFSLKNNFVKKVGFEIIIKGRRYDCALALGLIKFEGKTVCEVGARDSIFGSYVTQFADKVYVSDNFEGWGKGTVHDLGNLNHWQGVWTSAAIHPNRLVCETQDILNLSYADEMFDVVIATHVLNYVKSDTDGIVELARICKRGGHIIISVIVGLIDTQAQGSKIYDRESIYAKLIGPSGCKLVGPTDFDIGSVSTDGLYTLGSVTPVSPVSDVFFILEKN